MNAANMRARSCCNHVDVPDQCLHICRRNLSLFDVSLQICHFSYENFQVAAAEDADKCEKYLPHMHYCAGEGVDVTGCCEKAGIDGACLDICDASDVRTFLMKFPLCFRSASAATGSTRSSTSTSTALRTCPSGVVASCAPCRRGRRRCR